MSDIIMPLLGSSFPLGDAASFVESLTNPNERAIARAELAYFQGRPEDAYELAKPYLNSPQVGMRSSACLLVIYASLPLGRTSQAKSGLAVLERQMEITSPEERPIAAFVYYTAYSLLHLYDGAEESTNETVQFGWDILPSELGEGLRVFSAYIKAHQAYLRGEYEYALGVASSAISLSSKVYPIPFLYLSLVQCMCAIALKRPEYARAKFNLAWELAQHDSLIQAIVEHHDLASGLIESCIKPQDPDAYRDIINLFSQFSKGWLAIHNTTTGEDVAVNLSTTEFAISMLLNKNWSIREIATFLGVSENTVKTHVKSVYKKLSINNRKELKQFMLR